MIDLSRLESYQENNRIEAKKALGGFPRSFWETYSAFANTLGGIILLGVEEHADHSLHAVNLPNPDRLTKELWDTLNDPNKVSVNILTKKHVAIENVDGKRIIVVTVPRAHRYDKPVFIGATPLGGTYRRNGEGDYRCSLEEIESMTRDAAVQTPDMRVLEGIGLDLLSRDTVSRYRRILKSCRPNHVLEKLDDEEFLHKLGAVGYGKDGQAHPTAAGLLMFGNADGIVREFPKLTLCYRDKMRGQDGDFFNWSGNILDFFLFVQNEVIKNIVVPLSAVSSNKIDVDPVYRALKEALANCLINADYYGKGGIEIVKSGDSVTFSNPGGFRIDVEKAKTGGTSDPRNGALVKMFNLIDVGSGIGSGLPNIFAVWKRHGWLAPSISESFNPDRITLTLSIGNGYGKKSKAESNARTLAQRAAIIEYLTDHADGTADELSKLLGLQIKEVKKLLDGLLDSDIAVRVKDRDAYKLKR